MYHRGNPQSENGDKKPIENWFDRLWTDPNATFAGAVALFTFFLVWVGVWQGIQLRRTVEAANRAVTETRRIGEAQVRAYVNIKSVNIDFLWHAIVPRVDFVATNSGQSPARNFIWNMTLQYAGSTASRETMFNEKWLEMTGIDIPAASDAPKDGAIIHDMSIKQYIESVAPSRLTFVVRLKVDFRFTDIFDTHWFGEAFLIN